MQEDDGQCAFALVRHMKADAIGCDVHEKRFSRVRTARLRPPPENTLSTAVLLSTSRYRHLILAV
jgi:hypothetical protein